MFTSYTQNGNIVCMKRTNLMIDEKLLKEAVQVLGVRTYSDAVNLSLSESIRLRTARDILNFAGSGVWEGDLPEMRQDQKQSKTKKRHSR